MFPIPHYLPFPNKRAKPELNPGLTRVKRCGIGTGLKVGLLAYQASFWWKNPHLTHYLFKKPTFYPLKRVKSGFLDTKPTFIKEASLKTHF